MRMMSSISRWKRSGGGEDGMRSLDDADFNYTRRPWLRRGKLLQEVTLHPPFKVVILGLDFAPRAGGYGLVVACQQHAGAFAQHARALGLRAGLQADGDA